jgi:hypothetical protein
MYLREYPSEGIRMREAGRRTARYFTWEAAVQNLIGKLENQARIQELLQGRPQLLEPQFTLSKLPRELVEPAAASVNISVDQQASDNQLSSTMEATASEDGMSINTR